MSTSVSRFMCAGGVKPGFHLLVLGLNENIFVFLVLAGLSLTTLGALRAGRPAAVLHAA